MPLEQIYIALVSKHMFFLISLLYISGAVASLILCRKHKASIIVSNYIAIAGSIFGIAFALVKLLAYTEKATEFTLESNIPNISISIRIDNLSAFFILIIAVLALAVSIYSFGYLKNYLGKRNVSYLGFLYNAFVLSLLMVVSSGHLFFFLIVWELMSLLSYFLVVFEHDKPKTQKAGNTYIIMTHIGTAFIIAAFILIYKYSGTAYFSAIDLHAAPAGIKNIIFAFCIVGFGIKAGQIPMHIWLPLAYSAAPSNMSALMSGAMIKTAVYGIIRFSFFFLDAETQWWGIALLVIGGVSTILGITFALAENDIKKLLGYSSIENIGIVIMGLGLAICALSNGNTALAALSLSAALLHSLNHSLFKGLLFMGAGSIQYSTGTNNMEKLGGLIKRMPLTAFFFLAGALAISALPPFNGFISEWLVYQSLFSSIGVSESGLKIIMILLVALLALAGVLAATSFIKAFGISFLALPRANAAKSAQEVPKSMLWSMGMLSLMCLVAGVLPTHILKIIDGIAQELTGTEQPTAFGYFMLHVGKNNSSVSLLGLSVAALIMAPVVLLLAKKLSINTKKRTYGTWDCGYTSLNSKMQYTATGFSKPLRIVFRAIYRPKRELEVGAEASPYFFKSAKYVVSTQSIFEKYLYQPIIRNVVNFARRTRFVIQTGSIHTYLIYIFIVIIAMLIYYSRF